MIDIEILNKPLPNRKYIYHYTKTNVSIESIISKRELLFNSLVNTNDPLEFLNYCHVVSSIGESDKIEVRRLLDIGNETNTIIKKKFKICCFCEDNEYDGEVYNNNPIIYKGYCRSRMWSQYADNQNGVCLIFNKEKLIDKIGEIENIQCFIQRVRYDNNLKGLYETCDIDYDLNHGITALKRALDFIDSYLFLKLEDYEHEQEYRIALYSDSYNEGDKILVNYGDALEGIILGPRFIDHYLPAIISSYGTKKELPVFQITWFNGKPIINEKKKI